MVAFNGPMAFAGQGLASEVKKDQVLDQEKTQPDTGRTFGSITKSVVKNAAIAYGAIWAGLIAHEMGHAVAAKAFGLKGINIHVGGMPSSRPIFGLFDTFFVESLLPLCGSTYWYPECDLSSFGRLVISAAGPVAGIAAAGLLFKTLSKKHRVVKYCAAVTIAANLQQLNPSSFGSDGYQLMHAWKSL